MDRPPGERRLIVALIVITVLTVMVLGWQALMVWPTEMGGSSLGH